MGLSSIASVPTISVNREEVAKLIALVREVKGE